MSKKNHSNEKVKYMIGQMANFKCNEGYYATQYSSSYTGPKTWWQMISDPQDFLKNLACKIFSITPHSVTCERAFSALGFFYGKRRQCLSLSTIEAMAKIRYYLFSNIKNELNYSSKEKTEIELATMVQECGFFDDDNDDNDDNTDDEELFEDNNFEIPTNEVYVLIINDMVDITNSIFTEDNSEKINELENEETSDEFEEEELDNDIISSILAPANM
jgi:hAT family C-terminal dimerisation region